MAEGRFSTVQEWPTSKSGALVTSGFLHKLIRLVSWYVTWKHRFPWVKTTDFHFFTHSCRCLLSRFMFVCLFCFLRQGLTTYPQLAGTQYASHAGLELRVLRRLKVSTTTLSLLNRFYVWWWKINRNKKVDVLCCHRIYNPDEGRH